MTKLEKLTEKLGQLQAETKRIELAIKREREAENSAKQKALFAEFQRRGLLDQPLESLLARLDGPLPAQPILAPPSAPMAETIPDL